MLRPFVLVISVAFFTIQVQSDEDSSDTPLHPSPNSIPTSSNSKRAPNAKLCSNNLCQYDVIQNVDDSSVTLQWRDSQCCEEALNVTFVTDTDTDGSCTCDAEITVTTTKGACNLTIDNLCPNSNYDVTVNDSQCEKSFKSVPSQVSLEANSLNEGEIYLNWTLTKCPDNQNVFYVISYTEDGTYTRSTNSTGTNITIDQLKLKTEYNFTVRACDTEDATICGISDSRKVRSQPGIPSAPTDFKGTAENSTTIFLTWGPPAYPGGPSVDGYIVFCNDTKIPPNITFNATVSDEKCLVEGLQPGEPYICVVRAYHLHNGSKIIGVASNATETTDPEAPSEPQYLNATDVTSNALILIWTAPQNLGAPQLDGYIVEWWKTHSEINSVNISGSELAYVVKELASWTDYNFSVTAFNDVKRDGKRLTGVSAYVTSKTLSSAPSEPKNFVVKAINSSVISLSWEPPDEPRGPIDGYNIVCTSDPNDDVAIVNQTLNGEIREIEVSGLEPWCNYTCHIWAVNKNSDGKPPLASNTITVVTTTLPDAPSKPENLKVTKVTSNSVTLSWEGPKDPRGPLDGYVVSWTGDASKSIDVMDVNYTVDGLEPWTKYNFTVSAFNYLKIPAVQIQKLTGEINFVGERTWSSHPGGPPEGLTIVNVTAYSFALTWNDPTVKNGNIDGYILTLAMENVENFTRNEIVANGMRETLFDTLQPYETYRVRICAYNVHPEEGNLTGPCENITKTTLVDAPSIPRNLLSRNVAADHMTLAWEKPLKLNGPLDGYIISWGPFDPLANITDDKWKNITTDVTIRLDNLVPYTNYSFRVSAFNLLDKERQLVGDYSEKIIRRTNIAAPSPPEFLDVVPGSDFVEITWKSPEQPNGELNGFKLSIQRKQCRDETCSKFADLNNTNKYRFEGLEPWTVYDIVLMVFNWDDKSKSKQQLFSDPVKTEVHTKAGIPDFPITNLTELRAEKSQIEFAFSKFLFRDHQGPITEYSIIVVQFTTNISASKRRNGKEREQMESWVNSQLTNFVAPYQASPDAWDPYGTDENRSDPMKCEDYKLDKIIGRKCTIGVDSDCDEKANVYCNGPLRSGYSYMVKIRGFTDGGWSETYPLKVHVSSPSSSSNVAVPVAVSVTVIFLLVGSLLTTYVIKKKGLWPPKKLNSPFVVGKIEDVTTMNTIAPKNRSIRLDEFGSHVAAMLCDSGLKFSEEFEDLCAASPKHPCQVAELPGNKSKNRWANILPFDNSRVKLLPVQDDKDTDYINASYIPGNSSRREYIATQGPLPATKDDFWRMVWEQNVSMVVMLTLCTERGKAKCEQYWRDDWEPHYHCDCLKVVKISESVLSAYTIRIFDVQMGGQQRSVKHMHFTKWPDFGCPENPEILINFVRAVRDHLPHSRPGPIVVHCSAGVGRTGTFIAVDRLMQQIRDKKEHLDVYRMVLEMRDHRCSMVQTEDQYIYIHECVREIVKEESERSNTPVPDGYEIYSNLNFKETE